VAITFSRRAGRVFVGLSVAPPAKAKGIDAVKPKCDEHRRQGHEISGENRRHDQTRGGQGNGGGLSACISSLITPDTLIGTPQ